LANIQSQKKRNKQNEKRRIKNAAVKSTIRTANKSVLKMLESKETAEKEQTSLLYSKFVKIIDAASGKGIVNKKAAARKKSRLAKQVNSFTQQS